jgi:hypothetical protein
MISLAIKWKYDGLKRTKAALKADKGKKDNKKPGTVGVGFVFLIFFFSNKKHLLFLEVSSFLQISL